MPSASPFLLLSGGADGQQHLGWQIEKPGKVKAGEDQAVEPAALGNGQIPASRHLQADDRIAQQEKHQADGGDKA